MFLVALVSKLRDLPSFRATLRGFRVVPRRLEWPVASAVLGAEAAVVLLVVARPSAAVGLAVAVALLVAFAAGMARVVARGDRVPCGCFGRSSAPISRAHVGRNALLAAASAAGLVAGLTSAAEPLDGPVLLVAAWLTSLRSARTRRSYATDLLNWQTWLTHRGTHILAAARVQVDMWVRAQQGAGAGDTTVRRRLSGVGSFYRYCLTHDLVTTDPTVGVARPRVGPGAARTRPRSERHHAGCRVGTVDGTEYRSTVRVTRRVTRTAGVRRVQRGCRAWLRCCRCW